MVHVQGELLQKARSPEKGANGVTKGLGGERQSRWAWKDALLSIWEKSWDYLRLRESYLVYTDSSYLPA